IMRLHRYIDHDSQMTPSDFQVTRSKVKTAKKMRWERKESPGFDIELVRQQHQSGPHKPQVKHDPSPDP
ncbi:hypothetical protein DPMN_021899, partial [Dreissena polymorpha]